MMISNEPLYEMGGLNEKGIQNYSILCSLDTSSKWVCICASFYNPGLEETKSSRLIPPETLKELPPVQFDTMTININLDVNLMTKTDRMKNYNEMKFFLKQMPHKGMD